MRIPSRERRRNDFLKRFDPTPLRFPNWYKAKIGLFWPDITLEWLGHESVETTQIYLDANLALTQKVVDRTTPPVGKPGRYRPDDRLLAFLKGL